MVEGRTIHLLGAVRAVQGDSEHRPGGCAGPARAGLPRARAGSPGLRRRAGAGALARRSRPALRGRAARGDQQGAGLPRDPRAHRRPTIENVGRTYRFDAGRADAGVEVVVDVQQAARDVAEAEPRLAEGQAAAAAPARGAGRRAAVGPAAGGGGRRVARPASGRPARRCVAGPTGSPRPLESALGRHDAAVAHACAGSGRRPVRRGEPSRADAGPHRGGRPQRRPGRVRRVSSGAHRRARRDPVARDRGAAPRAAGRRGAVAGRRRGRLGRAPVWPR